MLVPTWMGTNMADGNQQKHSDTEFCYKTVKLSLEELINIKVIKVEPPLSDLGAYQEWSPIPLPCSLSLNLPKLEAQGFFFRVEESSRIILEESREGKGYITACKLLKLSLQKWLRLLA